MSATSHLRDPESGELLPPSGPVSYAPPEYGGDGRRCPSCSEWFEESEFVFSPEAGEDVCQECAAELRGIDK